MKKSDREIITRSLNDILWMAKRYSDGRTTYAPDMFNDALDVLVEHFELNLERLCRVDDGPVYNNNLTAPYALYDSQKRAALRWKPRKLYLDHYRFEQEVADLVTNNYKTGSTKKGNHFINIKEPGTWIVQKLISDYTCTGFLTKEEVDAQFRDVFMYKVVDGKLVGLPLNTDD